MRAADRPRPGRPRADPGPRRRLATPGAPGPADGPPPGPGPAQRQQQRLLDAYLAEVLGLPELQRKRQDLDRRHATLPAWQSQLDAAAGQRLELQAIAHGIEAFCQAIRARLATASFGQRRQLAEPLIDRVIITGDQAEIRYALPTTPDGPHRPFANCVKTISIQLRTA